MIKIYAPIEIVTDRCGLAISNRLSAVGKKIVGVFTNVCHRHTVLLTAIRFRGYLLAPTDPGIDFEPVNWKYSNVKVHGSLILGSPRGARDAEQKRIIKSFLGVLCLITGAGPIAA
ncbi:hypothetical protein C6496_07095 [Candidatus Poribacteria bacterium]|nr:MAG: hypothetical protein C6496_07095 [Candidatus Poribacteria bacterium]